MMSERASLFKEGNVIRVEQKVSDRDIMHMLFLSKSIKKKTTQWKYDNDT